MILSVVWKIPQICFQTFVDNFSLVIILGMIGDVEMQLTSCRQKNAFQKLLVKVGSWSDTIEWGMPWSLKILSMNIWSTLAAVNGCWREQKWAYLERRSTTTMMTKLFPYLGNPRMKSIEISHQIVRGFISGWSVHGFLKIFPLLRWHTSDSTTKVWISYFIPS